MWHDIRTSSVFSFLLAAGLLASGESVAAAAESRTESPEVSVSTNARTALGITIYNDGQALVRDTRTLNLQAGVNRIAFREVASTIRPETATLKSLKGAGFGILEANFDFDLLTPATLLRKYVGRDVMVIKTNPATGAETSEKAGVLATNDGVVLRFPDRIESAIPGRLAFGSVPANLRDRPTLSMLLNAPTAGPQEAELMYLANHLSWKADYAATLDSEGQHLNLSGWVTLTNRAGTAFENAHLQLIAGTLNRVRQPSPPNPAPRYAMAAAKMVADEVQEEKLFEYHLYSVERPTTILENQTKQVALLSAANVPVQRELVLQQANSFWWYQGVHPEIQKGLKPSVFIQFENRNGDLGKPIPAGVMRVYQRDSKGNAQLIGEDALNHTAKNEKVSLRMGEAFDVTADRVQTDYKSLGARSAQSSYRIELRNAGASPVSVTVREPLRGDWTIVNESQAHRKESAGSAVWQVKVPAEGKVILEYTANVKW